MLPGKSSLCESRPANHACQTNRAPHRGHIQPAREAETVERDCTSEPHRVRQYVAIENHARQQNEQRWRTAFENSAIGITMADFTGHLFAANCTFLNMLGYKVFPAFTRLLYWC